MEGFHSCPFCYVNIPVKHYYRHSVLEKLKHEVITYLKEDPDGSDVYNDHFAKVLDRLAQNFANPVTTFTKKLS